MAHVEKYTKQQVSPMLCHYNRLPNDGVKRKNENIDPEKTKHNYFFKRGTIDDLKRRLSEVKVQNRADVNVLCDWIVTLPKDVKKGDEEIFFGYCYTFISERYGAENMINGAVHKDEKNAHLHAAFSEREHRISEQEHSLTAREKKLYKREKEQSDKETDFNKRKAMFEQIVSCAVFQQVEEIKEDLNYIQAVKAHNEAYEQELAEERKAYDERHKNKGQDKAQHDER